MHGAWRAGGRPRVGHTHIFTFVDCGPVKAKAYKQDFSHFTVASTRFCRTFSIACSYERVYVHSDTFYN
jgi:hypothetical protein